MRLGDSELSGGCALAPKMMPERLAQPCESLRVFYRDIGSIHMRFDCPTTNVSPSALPPPRTTVFLNRTPTEPQAVVLTKPRVRSRPKPPAWQACVPQGCRSGATH